MLGDNQSRDILREQECQRTTALFENCKNQDGSQDIRRDSTHKNQGLPLREALSMMRDIEASFNKSRGIP